MSHPVTSLGAIMQPQNIIINQVPLTTVIPALNAATTLPIGAPITLAPPVEQPNEIKTGNVLETVSIPSRENLVADRNVPTPTAAKQSGAASQSQLMPPPAAPPADHEILSKTRLSDLLKEVDPTMVLEEDVEEVLMSYADQFIDNVIEGACTLAKHRQNNTIDVKDVQQYLMRNYNIWTPGSGTDELKPYKRNMMMESHKQRLALIRRSLKKY